MNDFIKSIISKCDNAEYKNYSSIEVLYKAESHVGNSNIVICFDNGEQIDADPSICSLDFNEMKFLKNSFESQKQIDKCNSVKLIIKDLNDFNFEYFWDEELFEVNKGYVSLIEEEEKHQLKLNEIKEDKKRKKIKNRFELHSNYNNCSNLLLSYDLSHPNIISQFYSRLYALFQVNPEIIYEGFMYNILDKSNNENFCAGLCSSGIGYFAKENSDLLSNSLNDFHKLIFTSEINLVECSITFENDFGKTEIGYNNKQFIQKNEENV